MVWLRQQRTVEKEGLEKENLRATPPPRVPPPPPPPPPPPQILVTDSSTQTTPPAKTVEAQTQTQTPTPKPLITPTMNSVSTNTDRSTDTTPVRTYAEAAISPVKYQRQKPAVAAPPPNNPQKHDTYGNSPLTPPLNTPNNPPTSQEGLERVRPDRAPQTLARTVVLHAVPT
ncbi:hypothetical protein BGX38DRAFT_1329231 [Terfezia claveryi]|nr:hypothetical protein BGX38DRAFT_1329231 [Terfezia claveryi]